MERRFHKGFIIIPLVYLVCIFGLFILQYSGQVPYEKAFGRLRIKASVSSGETELINQFSMTHPLYSIKYTNYSPFLLVDSLGRTEELLARYTEESPSGFHLSFGFNAELEIRIEENRSIFDWTWRDLPPDTQYIAFGLQPSEGVLLEYHAGLSQVVLRSSEESLLLDLPVGSYYSPEEERLYLSVRAEGLISEVDLEGARLNEQYAIDQIPRDFSNYEQTVNRVIDDAYIAWLSGRFQRNLGVWEVNEGTEYRNSIARSTASEALLRETTESVYLLLNTASRELNPDQADFSLMPLLGDVVVRGSELADFQKDFLERIHTDSLARKPSLFLEESLFARTGGSVESELFSRIFSFLTEDMTSFSLETLVGCLEYLYDAYAETGRLELREAIEALYRRILVEFLLEGENRIFLADQEEIDSLVNIKAGCFLLKMSEFEEFSYMANTGELLLLAILEKRANDGSVPRSFALSNLRLEPESSEKLYPEAFYSWLVDGYSPRYSSPGRVQNSYPVVFTSAPIEYDREGESLVLRFRFPVGKTHYLAITDVPEYSGVIMHGVLWNSDSYFTRYSDGWFYDVDRNLILIKITHRLAEETFAIRLVP